jgi:hypothetical protein
VANIKQFGGSKFPSLDNAKSFVKSKGYRYDSFYCLDGKDVSYIYKQHRSKRVAIIEKKYDVYKPTTNEFGNFYTVIY